MNRSPALEVIISKVEAALELKFSLPERYQRRLSIKRRVTCFECVRAEGRINGDQLIPVRRGRQESKCQTRTVTFLPPPQLFSPILQRPRLAHLWNSNARFDTEKTGGKVTGLAAFFVYSLPIRFRAIPLVVTRFRFDTTLFMAM